MIVFRKKEETVKTGDKIKDLRISFLRMVREGTVSLEAAREALMEWGIFESAVTDALCPQKDTFNRVTQVLRLTGMIAGNTFRLAWEGRLEEAAERLKKLNSALSEISALGLPPSITLREPEGYAHYGLFPETYMEAAKTCFDEVRPESAVVLGLRSIGTSLSLVVASVLEARGCSTASFTVRPRSHPFNRKITLTPEFERYLSGLPGQFIIVDEGPGISGTSFCGLAERLSELGIEDGRIIFFPSWVPDGSNLYSRTSRERWQRHRKYCLDFSDLWIKNNRLTGALPEEKLIDISAGGWRSFFYETEDEYPAVNLYHERRKFLNFDNCLSIAGKSNPNGVQGGVYLVKFTGFGSFGRKKYERAQRLAGAGFSQVPHGMESGFLITGFVNGSPVRPGITTKELLDEMARYLAFLKKEMPGKRAVGFDEFADMAVRNTSLGLGKEWGERLSLVERFRSVYDNGVPVAVDGRMLPNEWIRTKDGFMKTDAVDHHADQFFPGCQDIAWDLAGAVVEFDLKEAEKDYLLERFRCLTGDDARERIGFYAAAYLAFRLGYVTFAAEGQRGTPDGEKFKRLISVYGGALKECIIGLSDGPKKEIRCSR